MSVLAIRRIGWAAFGVTIALLVTGEVFNALALHPTWTTFFRFYPVALAFAVVGVVLITRRPENPIGRLASVIGFLSAGYDMANSFSLYAPSAGWTVGIGRWGYFPSELLMLGVPPLVFPTGRLLSRRWQPVLWLAGAAMVVGVGVGLSGFRAGDINLSKSPVLSTFLIFSQMAFLACMILSLSSLVVRYRHAESEGRQQLKWFLNAILLVVIVLLGSEVVAAAIFKARPYDVPFIDALIHLSFVAIPVAIGIAVLKYRLYDIDVVLNRTILFATMAVFISGVYVTVVAGLGALIGTVGQRDVVLSIAATALVAIAFEPVRQRVHRVASRLVYGKRATPYEVMADFGQRMAEALSVSDVLPRMAEAAARGVGALRGRVRLLLSDGNERVVSWPEAGTNEQFDHVFPVSHGGEPVGDIAVAKPEGEPLTPGERGLLEDLASQAGLAMHNARLSVELQARLEEISRQTDQLRESRQRIVSAQDEERRRLELAIRQGAEQQLTAIEKELDIVEQTLDRDSYATPRLLESLIGDANRTLEELRDLARGLYPPLLRDQGLLPALRAQAAKINPAIRVDGEGIGRFPAEVEGAVYFCCVEALRNSTEPTTVRLILRNQDLEFSVDAPALHLDGRLQDMEDRIAALGGSLTLQHHQLTGRIPVRVLEPVA